MAQNAPSPETKRRELADLVTSTVKQTADVIEEERKELYRRFPAMSHQPDAVLVDPSVIRDFTESPEYRQAIEAYIEGRLGVNILVKVLDLLEQLAPFEFGRL